MKVKALEPRKGEDNKPPLRRQKEAHQKYENGEEIMDPTPIAPPVGYKKAPTIAEQVRNLIRSERLRHEAEAQGYESFEESDDFNVGDDFDPRSPYEEVFEPTPQPTEEDRLGALGKAIGDTIFSRLGGDPEAASAVPPQGPSNAPSETAGPTPATRGAPSSTPSEATKTPDLASGFLKPRAT